MPRETIGYTSPKKLILKDDFSNILLSEPGTMTRERLEWYMDRLATTQADVVAVDMANPELAYYQTELGDIWGSHWDEDEYPTPAQWYVYQNIQNLIHAGANPIEVVAQRLHEHGLTFLAGIRVNDGHHRTMKFLRTRFYLEHPEWVIEGSVQMDYALPGVRAHRLKIVKEILSYDVDGILLDFIRSAPYVSPPAKEKAHFLSEYVAEVRAQVAGAAREKGRPVFMGAIVPWDLALLEELGADVARWMREGWLDFVCPGEQRVADWNLPVDQWAALAAGTDCLVCPSAQADIVIDRTVRADQGDYQPMLEMSVPHMAACAQNFYSQGADGILFYNLHGHSHGHQFAELPKLRDPATLRFMPRHYFYARQCKYRYGSLLDIARKLELVVQEGKEAQTYDFILGETLSPEKATLRFKTLQMVPQDDLSVSLNGTSLDDSIKMVPLLKEGVMPQETGNYGYLVWEAPLGSPPAVEGKNRIAFQLRRKAVRISGHTPIVPTGRDPLRFPPDSVAVREIEIWVEPD